MDPTDATPQAGADPGDGAAGGSDPDGLACLWESACATLDRAGFGVAASCLRHCGIAVAHARCAEQHAATCPAASPQHRWAAGLALQAAHMAASLRAGSVTEGERADVVRLLAGADRVLARVAA